MKLQGRRKIKEGIVLSNKANKTVTVCVERTYPHPRYKKVITRGKKCYAHYDGKKGELKVGQRVRIQETRPLSRLKRWLIIDLLVS